MKLKLTEWQRSALHQLVGNTHGTLARLRKGEKVLRALEAAGPIDYNADPGSDGKRTEVEIADHEAMRLAKEQAGEFGGWPMAALDQVADLFKQLGLEGEENETR